MPTTFTSYWGSSLHGVEIAWTHDPAAAGTPELSFQYTANYYWRMPYWYDSVIASDIAIKDAIGSAYGLDTTSVCTAGGYSDANLYFQTGTSRAKFNF